MALSMSLCVKGFNTGVEGIAAPSNLLVVVFIVVRINLLFIVVGERVGSGIIRESSEFKEIREFREISEVEEFREFKEPEALPP